MNNWTLFQMLGGIAGQREIFEEICRKIVLAEHPSTRPLREHKGDHGIDFFSGDWQTGMDVYQVKFFREEVGDSQQAQIRKSYDKILEEKGRVKSWTLMLPLELSFEEMLWFEGWKRKKDHDIRLASGFQLEEKLKRPKYKDALSVLSGAFSMAGLQLKWSERPIPILRVVFGTGDPYQSEAYKVVYVRVMLENVGKKSVKNPRVNVHYSDPGIVELAQNPVWKKIPGMTGLNPRILEADRTIRPGESLEVLPIQYPLARFREIGVYCKLMMDDESPVQSGVTISIDEVPQNDWKEKLGEENFFPVLHPCPPDPDPNQNLSPVAKDILNKILSCEATNEGKGIIVIHGRPSNNEATACVFSLRTGQTEYFKRNEFKMVLEELIQTGFLLELDREPNMTRYKLIE